jgi:hypothetical protein
MFADWKGAAHSSHGEVGKWGKMNADLPTLKTPRDYWSGIRRNVMRTLGVDGVSDVGSRGLPVVVYIDAYVSFSLCPNRKHG